MSVYNLLVENDISIFAKSVETKNLTIDETLNVATLNADSINTTGAIRSDTELRSGWLITGNVECEILHVTQVLITGDDHKVFSYVPGTVYDLQNDDKVKVTFNGVGTLIAQEAILIEFENVGDDTTDTDFYPIITFIDGGTFGQLNWSINTFDGDANTMNIAVRNVSDASWGAGPLIFMFNFL